MKRIAGASKPTRETFERHGERGYSAVRKDSQNHPLARLVAAAGFATLALILFGAMGCSQVQSTPSQPRVVSPQTEGPATESVGPPTPADPREQERLDADLIRAIDSALPSMSPDALDAHIRKVTGAPYSMIVAPYDAKAEPETEEFGKTWVAGYGTDAGITTEFQGLIYDSRGKPLRDFDAGLVGVPLYFAGRAVRVQGRSGYVLVGRPVQR